MGKSALRRSSPPTDSPPAPAPRDDPAADATIAATREQLAKPPKTTIHRVDTDDGEQKFCATVLTELATEEFIARRFGPGKYRLSHRKSSENGSYTYAGADTVEIDERAVEAIDKRDDVETDPAAGASSPAVPAGGNILERAMEAGVLRLLEQSARQNDLTIAMIERLRKDEGGRSPTDWVALFVAVAPIIKELLASRKDPTEVAIAIANVMKKNSDAGPDPLASLERVISIANKIGDRTSDSSDSILPIVGKGVEALGGIVEAVLADRRAARGDAAAVGTPSNPPLALVPNVDEAAAVPKSSSVPDRPWIAAARPQLALLLAAARFMPAGAAAETIAANLTAAQFDDLLTDIEDTTAPGFAGRLVQLIPQVGQIRPEWFQELLRELLELAGPGDVDDTARATGASS